jgi:hypothetical protein
MEIIRSGQFAVFFMDVRNGIEVDAEGRLLAAGIPSSCLVFDSFDEAQAYCRERVARVRNLRCEIFDRRGKALPPAAIVVHPEFKDSIEESAASGRRKTLAGAASLALAAAFTLWDWRSHWTLILPSVIAVNLLFAGLRLLHWGFATKQLARARY